MKEYNALTNQEKVETALQYVKDCYGHDDTKYKVMAIGNIVSGYAYCHEDDKELKMIGLQVQVKVQYDFQDKPSTDVGFYPIYVGRAKAYDPVSFTETYSDKLFEEHRYENGYGDHIEVAEILIPRDRLEKLVDLNKYSKIK